MQSGNETETFVEVRVGDFHLFPYLREGILTEKASVNES